ncbi:monocarboxylate transporter 14-like isoform X2 [Patiria miniata]|uniref:Major facilitator superfamily (MFS) profile domain-containing protein n=1 Tax=Patiria miniata TaxID=46514 RepID=A0A914A0W0_PATMI|nr:monocarboxylate transporter 14-like isoform X2 [Patiria miniata]
MLSQMSSSESEARHWPILLAGFVVNCLTYGAASAIGVFYIEWFAEFPESAALIGWLSSSLLTMLLCVSPLAGALTRYFGVRPVAMAGALLSFPGILIASFATDVYVLIITLPFMAGIGFGMSYTGVMVIISEYFHQHFALAVGIATTGTGVGTVVLPIFFGYLIDRYGWRGALLVFSAVQANACLCAAIMRSPPRKTKTGEDGKKEVTGNYGSIGERRGIQGGSPYSHLVEDKDEDDDKIVSSSQVNSDPCSEAKTAKRIITERLMTLLDRTGISLFWTNRVFVTFLIISITDAPIYGITLPYLTALAESVGVPELQATTLISIIGVSYIIACLISGQLVDARVAGPACMFGSAVALASGALVLFAATASYPVFAVCASTIGLAAGVYIPMTSVMVRRIVGQERYPGGIGVVMVIVATGNMASAFIGAVVSGLCAATVLGLHLLWTRLVPDDRWPTITTRSSNTEARNKGK